jgi:hypothetical protein
MFRSPPWLLILLPLACALVHMKTEQRIQMLACETEPVVQTPAHEAEPGIQTPLHAFTRVYTRVHTCTHRRLGG